MNNNYVQKCRINGSRRVKIYEIKFHGCINYYLIKKRIMIMLYRSIAVHSYFYLKAHLSRCVHRSSIRETTNTHTIYDVKAQFNNISKGLFCAKCDLCSTFRALRSRVLCTGPMCVYMNIRGGNKNFLRYGRCRHPIRTY